MNRCIYCRASHLAFLRVAKIGRSIRIGKMLLNPALDVLEYECRKCGKLQHRKRGLNANPRAS